MLVRFICWLLKHKKLSTKDRQLLTNQALTSIGALPTHAILTRDGNKLFIRGVPLDDERKYILRDAAEHALHNPAMRAIHEEVLYQAISLGVHQAHTPEAMQFAKAAIWWGQEQDKLLKTLAELST